MNITFIGGGNMASAIIGGLLAKRGDANTLRIVDIQAEARERIAGKYPGVGCFGEAREAIRDGDVIVLAVKPQHMRAALAGLCLKPDSHLVISIAAGITTETLVRWLGNYARIIRAMPNTPALVGAGGTGLYAAPGQVSAEDRLQAEAILGAVGTTLWVSDPGMMDAVTAVSGSGPAYVFYFMEALEEAARGLGLPANTARELALQTFSGAAKLAASSAEPAATLRERVTSKGGTTEAALKVMAANRVKDSIVQAVNAANERGREMGVELGRDA